MQPLCRSEPHPLPRNKSERFIASPPGRPQRQSIMRLCGIGCKGYICISSVLHKYQRHTSFAPYVMKYSTPSKLLRRLIPVCLFEPPYQFFYAVCLYHHRLPCLLITLGKKGGCPVLIEGNTDFAHSAGRGCGALFPVDPLRHTACALHPLHVLFLILSIGSHFFNFFHSKYDGNLPARF